MHTRAVAFILIVAVSTVRSGLTEPSLATDPAASDASHAQVTAAGGVVDAQGQSVSAGEVTPSAEVRIEGTVVEWTSGKPVGGIRVAAHADPRVNPAQPSRQTVTGPDGTFRIGGLAAGSCIVGLATEPGQAAQGFADKLQLFLRAGETRGGIRIRFTRAALLEVHVKDPAGKPVDRVLVGVCHAVDEQGYTGTTDESGFAAIRVRPGQYDGVRLSRRGYAAPADTKPLTMEEGDTKRIEYTVRPTPKTVGIVRDEAGNPLANVQVATIWRGPQYPFTTAVESKTSGEFHIDWYDWVVSRDVTAAVEQDAVAILMARDPARDLAGTVAFDARTRNLDLRLKPGVILTGTVLDQEGKPLPRAHVQIALQVSGVTVPLSWMKPVTAGRDGVIEITAIPAELEYAVIVDAHGYGKQEVPVKPLDPKENRHDIGQVKLVRANLSVSGMVVDPNGNPVANARVWAFGVGQPDSLDTGTDAQGRFTLEGVCPGPLKLDAQSHVEFSTSGDILCGDAPAEGGATNVRIMLTERIPVGPPPAID